MAPKDCVAPKDANFCQCDRIILLYFTCKCVCGGGGGVVHTHTEFSLLLFTNY